MPLTDTRRLTLAEHIHQLANTHRTTQHYTIRVGLEWRNHTHHVEAPPLIAQLWDNDIPSATTEDGPRPGYASKPAASLEALDTVTWIDTEAARWIRLLGHDDRHTSTTATLRQLHSLAIAAPADTREAIERDVRHWWIRARIVTGWDSPPWTPNNTCPQCGERGTLRIRLADSIGTCTEDGCRTVWGPEVIGVLADHIRAESESERQPMAGPGPCWCPVPKPVVPDLGRLCPGCGSARCRHAVGARLLDTIRAAS